MARVRTTVYKKSFLATLISLLGTCIMCLGGIFVCASIFGVLEGELTWLTLEAFLVGLLIVAAGFGMSFLGAVVSNIAAHKRWVEDIRKKGLETEIQRSVEIAASVYMTNQTPRALKYISELNSQAGEYLNAYLEQQKEMAKAEAEERAGQWACSVCDHKNPAKAMICEKCHTVK